MEYVFAGAKIQYFDMFKRNGVKWFLISYLNKDNIQKFLPLLDKSHHTIVDSGAFSVWTLGKEIDIDEYGKYCQALQKQFKNTNLYFVSLDKIPGSPGTRPTLEMIQASGRESVEKYHYLANKYGVTFIPVFHQHEELSILEEYISLGAKYIGISPANDLKAPERVKRLQRVFAKSSLIKNKIKTHGFGATAFRIIDGIPFYTADSMSRQCSVLYNQYYYYSNGKIKTISAKNFRDRFKIDPSKMTMVQKAEYNVVQLNKYLSRLRQLHKIKGLEYWN